MAQGLTDAYDPDFRVTRPPSRYPSRYGVEYLELARQLEDSGGGRILNPRDVGNKNLFEADAEWLSEFSLYKQHVRYKMDLKRKPVKGSK